MLVNTVLVLLSFQWVRFTEPGLSEGGAGLFRGSDKHDFAFEIPPAGMECFWHLARHSGSFYLTYMVQWVTGISSDHKLFVTVNSPHGALMASKNDFIAHLNFQTEVTGFYQMCFRNQNNQFGSVKVFLNFGVVYEEMEEGEKVLNSTVAGIEESVQKLQTQIFHMWRHYNFARMRKGKDHLLLLSNLHYVSWWSAAQSLVILLTGYLQVLVLKRLLHTNQSRSRC